MIYKKRIVDDLLSLKLRSKGAVVIEGPKWCGKTTTALQQSRSVLKVDEPDKRQDNLELSRIKPSLLLEGETPRLIDEWQVAPLLWDAVRNEVDERSSEGQFILTGSSVGSGSSEITHSGTGRFTWLKMRTMSLFESGESTGDISLSELFKTPKEITGKSKLSINDVAFAIARGGWPHSIDMDKDVSLLQAYDYYDGVVKSDVNRVDGIGKNEERVKRLLRSYARNIGTQASYSSIKKDTASNDSDALSENTLLTYINALKKIYVIEDMPAWNPNLRSKTAIRTADTRYFSDPSIAVASLGLGVDDLFEDMKTFGFLFESLVVRDLRIYAESIGGNVYHYRDKNDLECDAVIHLRNGHYGLVEIKLGGEEAIQEAAKSLKKVREKIDTDKMKEPSFMMIVVGVGNYAYKRDDGVYIVPIGSLRN